MGTKWICTKENQETEIVQTVYVLNVVHNVLLVNTYGTRETQEVVDFVFDAMRW